MSESEISAALTPLEYYILLVLAEQRINGSAILFQVRIKMDNYKIRSATFYLAIATLIDSSFIEIARKRIVNGHIRSIYKITAAGHTAVNNHREKIT